MENNDTPTPYDAGYIQKNKKKVLRDKLDQECLIVNIMLQAMYGSESVEELKNERTDHE